MSNKKLLKWIILIICLIAVCGYGVYAFTSWSDYKQEKDMMTSGNVSDNLEVFHDQGHIYMDPTTPTSEDDVTVRIRSNRYGVTKAQVQITLDEGTTWTSYEMVYEKTDDTGYYDLWIGKIPAQSEPYFYRFAVGTDIDNATMYLGTEGLRSYQIDKDEMFYVIPDFDTPEWSKGTMWYYVHTGQFFNGDTTNDIYREYLMKDNTYGNDSQSMYRGSGDLTGISEKLDYIQDLGVESIAMGPIFSSSETLGFGTDNMAAVETAYGTENNLKNLIKEVHDRDMQITSEMVISYATNYSKYYNAYGLFPEDGAYQSKDSDYYEMFRFPQWPYNAVKIWGSMGLNVDEEKAQNLIYKNKDSMVLKYLTSDYGLDGLRFDAEESVGNLGYEYEPEMYWEDITNTIKDVSDDKLILSENCTGIADQYNTLFDSSWQKQGYFAMKGWFEGTKTGSQMLETLQENLINTARPRALSSYNFLGQHDVVRLWNDTETQKTDINAVILLHMTYLGSPVIYYGDEIGLANGYYDNQYYSTFNWDESEWDYNIYNLVKSLGKLRQEYGCLKTGAICHGEVDDSQLFLSFGRFDDDGAVITLCNKQSTVVEREINVSRYHVKDGDTLTDYLTGEKYTVKNGKVKVTIIPGGTVLVTDSNLTTSASRGQYTLSKLAKEIQVIQKDTTSFELSGKGTIEGKKDDIGFVSMKTSNNAALSVSVSTKGGKAGIMLRGELEQKSAYYGAIVQNKKLTVMTRTDSGAKAKTIASVTLPEDAMLRMVRENGNQFAVYYKASEDTEWTKSEDSVCTVEMPEVIYAGMTVLKGTVTFSDVAVEALDSQISDDFEGEILGSMFGKLTDNMKLQKGTLKLISKKDKLVSATANAHSSDFTFKAEVGSITENGKKDNAFAGVTSMTDTEDCVVVARAKINGAQVIAFGKLEKGEWVMAGKVTDTDPDKNVTLQLQRIGSIYTAVASYDGENYFSVGSSLYCNYTGMKAGVIAFNATAAFEYACFGDSIHDGVTTNVPMTLGEISTSYAEMNQNIEGDKMSYLGNEDTWKDIGAGYEQTKAEGLSMLYCENKTFEDVKAETSVQINGGSGTAGIILAKQEPTKDLKNCYQIALAKARELSVAVDGKVLASCKLDVKEDNVRLVVRMENGYIHVYAGEKAKLVLSVEDDTYTGGYVAYYTDNVKASFENYDITALDSTWNAGKTVMGTENALEMREGDSLLSLEGVGITEGVVAFQADTTLPKDSKLTSEIGLILGGSAGQKAGYGGVSVMYNYKTGILEAREIEESLGKVKLVEPDAYKSLSLMVVYRNGKYDIYANQSSVPVLTVQASKPNGGGVSFYSNAGVTSFYNIGVKDISVVSDVETLDVVMNWRKTAVKDIYGLSSVAATGSSYSDDFANYEGWNENFYKIKTEGADWYIEDSVLKADSKIKNWNIATITNGLYDDVEISMKVCFTDYTKDTNSSFSINLGKQNIYAGREETGLSLTVFGSGLVRVYDTTTKETLNGWNTYLSDLDEWFELKIRVSGNQVVITGGGIELYNGSVSSLQNGYIALQSDYVNLEVDNLKIKPLS